MPKPTANWKPRKAALQQANEHHGQCKADSADRQRELDRLTAERNAVEAESSDRTGLLQETRAQLEQAQLDFAALEGQTQSAKVRESNLETRLAASDERRIAADYARNAERLELAKQAERLQALRNSHERHIGDERQFAQQAEEAERRLHQVVGDRRRIAIHILNTNSKLAESLLKSEAVDRQVAQISREEDAPGAAGRAAQGRERPPRGTPPLERASARRSTSTPASYVSRWNRWPSGSRKNTRCTWPTSSPTAPRPIGFTSQNCRGAAGENPNAAPRPNRAFEDVREELESRVARLRRQLKLMGSVNTESLRDLEELERRFTQLSEQLADLVEAKRTLEEILRRISEESKRLFNETFQLIRGHFKELFRKFFGGGEGDIVLENDDVLECGIDIVARPPGKELRSISLLSGGEAHADGDRPVAGDLQEPPEPVLHPGRSRRGPRRGQRRPLCRGHPRIQRCTQFVMITHSKRSMAAADVLYGVTMEESGVSKRLSVKFEDVAEDGQIKTRVAA